MKVSLRCAFLCLLSSKCFTTETCGLLSFLLHSESAHGDRTVQQSGREQPGKTLHLSLALFSSWGRTGEDWETTSGYQQVLRVLSSTPSLSSLPSSRQPSQCLQTAGIQVCAQLAARRQGATPVCSGPQAGPVLTSVCVFSSVPCAAVLSGPSSSLSPPL